MVNRVTAKLIIRQGTASEWTERNPILSSGEYGLETDTYLIKIGDNINDWQHLPYLNKLNASYFERLADGSLTLESTFAQQINNLIANAGGGTAIVIDTDPTQPTDPVNLRYLEWAIAHAGHLTRSVVESLPTDNIDENNIYLIASTSGIGYDEYMYINGSWDMVGTTNDSGSFTLMPATTTRLGGVKASTDDDKVNVTVEGFMTVNKISTSKLYVPTGDTLVLYGGSA